MEYQEHEKRAWSVDFSRADPTKLASGSDDCCVKLWSINTVSIMLLESVGFLDFLVQRFVDNAVLLKRS